MELECADVAGHVTVCINWSFVSVTRDTNYTSQLSSLPSDKDPRA